MAALWGPQSGVTATSRDVAWASSCCWLPAGSWGSACIQRMLCLANGFEISLSPRSGPAGMRKWLLVLGGGWRKKSPGSLSGGGCAGDEDATSEGLQPFLFHHCRGGGGHPTAP